MKIEFKFTITATGGKDFENIIESISKGIAQGIEKKLADAIKRKEEEVDEGSYY